MERPKRSKEKVFGAQYVTHDLEIAGLVNHPQLLSVDELREMELTEVRDVTMLCGSGRNEGFIESYRGVLLTTVLKRVDVIMREHDSPNWIYVTVFSSDGHWALFSYQELFNTPIGEQAIVIVERDGRPLGEKKGKSRSSQQTINFRGPANCDTFSESRSMSTHLLEANVNTNLDITIKAEEPSEGSEQILHEAASHLTELYGSDLEAITIERLVVGVFFTGVKLSNGCGGVAYTPPEAIQRASTRILKGHLPRYRGMPVTKVIGETLPGAFASVIRLATLNALSVPMLSDGRYVIGSGDDLTGFRQLFSGKRICMVGAIIPLLKRLGELGVADVAIVDKKKETKAEARLGRFVPVEEMASELAHCQTAVFTGASIANGSIEHLLECVPEHADVAVVGPTAGFVPDPLFRRKVAVVGTVVVTEIDKALEILAEGGGAYQLFGMCVRKINLINPAQLELQ